MKASGKKLILPFLLFGYVLLNGANCQKDEKKESEVRSLGHKRTIVEPYYIDKPVLIEQPVYYPYPYPYPYAYPYSFTYQYPYAYPSYTSYPYNYSYSYTRTTRPATGAIPPYPPPAPFLRYLGEKQENDESVENQRHNQEIVSGGIEMVPTIQQDENILSGEQPFSPPQPPSPQMEQQFSPQPQLQPGEESIGLPEAEEPIINPLPPVLMKKIETGTGSGNSTLLLNSIGNNDGKELPEVAHNNSSDLRVLGKRDGLAERVEKTVGKVFDRLKLRDSDSDNVDEDEDKDKTGKRENSDNERNGDKNNKGEVEKDENKENNLKRNNKNVIKQVFGKIEDIFTNTLN